MTDIPDQVKWRKVFQNLPSDLKALVTLAGLQGIIPNPINATRVNAGSAASGDASATIYTVPVGSVLFISSISVDVKCGVTVGTGLMRVKNKAGVEQYRIVYINLIVASTREHAERYFCPALEASAEWYVEVTGSAATLYVRGDINGWIEDV